jgi:hypothetical protein
LGPKKDIYISIAINNRNTMPRITFEGENKAAIRARALATTGKTSYSLYSL